MSGNRSIETALRSVDASDKETVRKHLISAEEQILCALDALNKLSGDTLTLFVVDANGKLLGSLTDGDIRRALVAGATLQTPVAEVCKRNPLIIDADDTGKLTVSDARKHDIILLPIVRDGFILSLIDLRKMRGYLPLEGVLMAGGAGERLRPLTNSTPKPLLPVGGKAIIDYNIELMRSFGIDNIYITVNYLKEQLIRHASRLREEGINNVRCIEEPEKLGTIGSLTLIPDLRADNIIVMNSDLLTDINFEEMYRRHIESDAEMTVAVIPYTVSVPFAIMSHTGDRVSGITEKPTYNYFANAGIYMLRKSVITMIPHGRYMDAPELVEKLIKDGRKVSQFPIHGRWIDIGSPDDYRHACDIME